LASLIVTINNQGKESTADIAQSMQGYMQDIPGSKIIASAASAMRGQSTGQVQVLVQGPDLNTLTLLSNEVTNIMTSIPQLNYVDNQMATGLPSYQLSISHNALVQYGLTEQQVISSLRTAFQGTTASTFYQGDNQYDIVVRFPQDYSRDVTKVLQTDVSSNAGNLIPLAELASLNLAQDPSTVMHVDGTRSVYVQASVVGISTGDAQTLVQKKLDALKIPAGYQVSFGQNAKFMNDAFSALGIGILVSIALVYMVMASLFESLLTPFVIMFSLPPTFVGAILGLFLTHKTINMNSLMGIIMLIGLVTNNAIVLVDYTNQLKEKGMTLSEALIQAGAIRLRPILLTTVTNVLAMLPMLVIGGSGSEGVASMAAVITFGLSLSTLVTLVLVPVMYVNMDTFLMKRETKKQAALGDAGGFSG
jgi:HAE1 family hydrophobic/amphiphilic exporter-1